MAKLTINTGRTPNDKQGDSLRGAFTKINSNFTELYTALGINADVNLNLGAFEFNGSVLSTTDSSAIVIDQAVTVSSNLTVGGDVLPSVANGGDLGSSTRPWRSLYVSNNTIFLGGTSLSVDSQGNLLVGGQSIADVGTAAWNSITGKPTFATVATTGAYADLTGKPTIPTSFSSLVNGASTVSLASTGALTIPGDIRSEGNINIDINLSDSTLHRWQFGEDGGLTFPDGYLKIVPNGANPYISNIIDNGLGLVSGNFIQIRQSVADAYGISINSSITDTGLGGVELASGSNIDVNGSKIILGQYTSNYLDANNGLTGQLGIEINNNDKILIGQYVSTLVDGVTSSTFSGWTFEPATLSGPKLTFPDSTVQSTAYNPNSIRSEGDINIEINLSDSTLRRWRFGEDGELTLPDNSVIASYKPVTVIAATTAPQTITDNASAAFIQFIDTVDTNGAFSTGTFTAPYTGYYQINMSVYFSTTVTLTSGSFFLIDTNLDNTKQVTIFNGAWTGSYLHYSTVIPATSGDAIRVAFRQVSGAAIDISSGSRLTIHRVSIS